jgi:hypothetical protein
VIDRSNAIQSTASQTTLISGEEDGATTSSGAGRLGDGEAMHDGVEHAGRSFGPGGVRLDAPEEADQQEHCFTGSGFSASLDDAEAIAESVAAGAGGSVLAKARRGYEKERLSSVATMNSQAQGDASA